MKEYDIPLIYSIDLELLINYVEGSATKANRQQIDQYLNDHEEERLVINGISNYYKKYGMDRQSLFTYVQELRNISLPELKAHTTRKRITLRWVGWAAAFLVICLGSITYLFIGERSSYQSSVISHLAEPYPVIVFLTDQKSGPWMDAYQNGDYQQSAVLLDRLVQKNQDDNTALLMYYAGLSHLYSQPPQPETAITYLSQVNEGTLVPQARWYLALAYLLDEQVEKAQPLLKQLVDTQAYHHEEAAELLARISQD